ncbi:MAG: hypothetical protein M9942_03000 [Microthrixaceae bacterium]|nr:hypothetical protein [Microthrixaceae bacterium]
MDERPRSLRAMLAEAKDSSELMIDLAYAAVYFNDPGMASEVSELESRMNDLVQDMREVCILAVRRPAEAEGMASVLQVISAIEGIANASVDVTRIVTHRLGIPDVLIADLSNAEEVSHRVWVREGSHMAHRPLKDLELPVQCGMRVMAIRRDRSWMIDEVHGDLILKPGDVLFLRGSPAGISRLHELAAAPRWDPLVPSGGVLSDLDRAVDVLVEMKNISEAAVGLAYSALALRDVGLASEVRHLAERLDEMKDHLQLWVLRAAKADPDLSQLRGLLQLASAAEELGDQANHMVWLIADDYELHPIVNVAFGEADVVATRVPVAAGSAADGRRLVDLQLDIEPGFHVLAIRRDHRYLYRPRGYVALHPGDELIASGPAEGQNLLAETCGWWMDHHDDDPTGVVQLVPLEASRRH